MGASLVGGCSGTTPAHLAAAAGRLAGVPVLLSVAPLRSLEEAEYLANEVPDVRIPPAALRAMERAGRGAARAAGLQLAADLLRETREVVGGALLTAPEEDPAALLPLLAAVT